MRVLVIGSGAREHAIVWKLAQSKTSPELYVAPGNAGTRKIATNLPIQPNDLEALIGTVKSNNIDLTIVGPEGPLHAGIVDRFRSEGLPIFGPTKQAAQLETSKIFAKNLMKEIGVPTASFAVFDDYESARVYVHSEGVPIVIKADGLAAGKGVVVAQTINEAEDALDLFLNQGALGESGSRVLIEKCLTGQEVSVFCFTDGTQASSLVAACDYKRIGEGDTGPNTGGMGSYSPPVFWDQGLERNVKELVFLPVIRAMADRGMPYSGVLYAGLMLTGTGPMVIEFNARLGDPEAQVILPRLQTDLIDLIQSVVHGGLEDLELQWSPDFTVGVVLVSSGYPGSYETGKQISGLDEVRQGAALFHAATDVTADGGVITAGGRVLTLVAWGSELATARKLTYDSISGICFDGAFYRADIARPSPE